MDPETAQYKWILSTRPTKFQRTRSAGYAAAGASDCLTKLLAVRTDVGLNSLWFHSFGEKVCTQTWQKIEFEDFEFGICSESIFTKVIGLEKKQRGNENTQKLPSEFDNFGQ
jgi:hypothetical protein